MHLKHKKTFCKHDSCIWMDDRWAWNGGFDTIEGGRITGQAHSRTTGGETGSRGGTSYACLTCFKKLVGLWLCSMYMSTVRWFVVTFIWHHTTSNNRTECRYYGQNGSNLPPCSCRVIRSGIWKCLFHLVPLHTMAKGHVHRIVKETILKATPWKIEFDFCVVTGLLV
jgi:hypothetical protein